uniref:Uncharacterized protein n=1 Tax=viral metagenome TaxID=1070528 RepID=A0A6C0H5D7_9ZZZZ
MTSLNIIEPTIDFDFSNLNITYPVHTQGNNLITKIVLNNKPLYVYAPKSLLKINKKYCDLIYNHDDIVFIQWIESLEHRIKILLLERANKEKWFRDLLDEDDIEQYFYSIVKPQKLGRYFIRINNIKPDKKIFNSDFIIPLSDIDENTFVSSILSIQSLKLSKESFQLNIEFMQGNIDYSFDFFNKSCFKKKNNVDKFEEVCENKKVEFTSNNNGQLLLDYQNNTNTKENEINIKENNTNEKENETEYTNIRENNETNEKENETEYTNIRENNETNENENETNIKENEIENEKENENDEKENENDEKENENDEIENETNEKENDEYSDILGNIDFDDEFETFDFYENNNEKYLELYKEKKENMNKIINDANDLYNKYQELKEKETIILSELNELKEKYKISEEY